MAVNGSPDVRSVPAAPDGAAVDVHAHAMPLPLLQRLAEQGLADLGAVAEGVVRLDPRVSGVGPWTPWRSYSGPSVWGLVEPGVIWGGVGVSA